METGTEAFDHGLGSGSRTMAVTGVRGEDRVGQVASSELFFAQESIQSLSQLGVIDRHLSGREGCGRRKSRKCPPFRQQI